MEAKINDERMEAIASYMQDDLREQVHSEIAPCSAEEFITRYLQLDPSFSEVLKSEFRDVYEVVG